MKLSKLIESLETIRRDHGTNDPDILSIEILGDYIDFETTPSKAMEWHECNCIHCDVLA